MCVFCVCHACPVCVSCVCPMCVCRVCVVCVFCVCPVFTGVNYLNVCTGTPVLWWEHKEGPIFNVYWFVETCRRSSNNQWFWMIFLKTDDKWVPKANWTSSLRSEGLTSAPVVPDTPLWQDCLVVAVTNLGRLQHFTLDLLGVGDTYLKGSKAFKEEMQTLSFHFFIIENNFFAIIILEYNLNLPGPCSGRPGSQTVGDRGPCCTAS